MMKNCGIYQIRNIKNNKIYVGSSKDLKKRKADHINLLKNNNHPNRYLQFSWNKNGEKQFRYYIVEYWPEKDLREREQMYIEALWDSGKQCYNMAEKSTGGSGSGENNPFYGKKHTKEVKKKLSEIGKGRKLSKKTRQKIGEKTRGKNYEEIMGEEKAKKVKKQRKKAFTGSKNPQYNPVIYHFIHDSGVEEKCTQLELRKKYNLESTLLSSVIKGKANHHKGWRIK